MVEMVNKRRLGNGLLQCTIIIEMKMDLELEDCWIALFENRTFIVEDLKIGEICSER